MNKEQIRLFIADIDGTLRSRSIRTPGPKTIEAFRKMRENGITLCIASGRPLWQNLEDHYKEWGVEQFDYLIGMNGGEVWRKEDQSLRTYHMLSTEDIHMIVDVMDELDFVNPFLYYDRNIMLSEFEDTEMKASAMRHNSERRTCTDRSQLWEKPTGKMLFRCHTEENAWIALQHAQKNLPDRFACFRTGPTLLEIQYKEVSKASGMEVICEDLNITMDNVIAFGDAENDIEMLEEAGWSVCLLNGMEDVKAICDDVTEYTADEDGVGKYLLKHLL